MIIPLRTTYYIGKDGEVISRNDTSIANVPITPEFAVAAIKALTGQSIGDALEHAAKIQAQYMKDTEGEIVNIVVSNLDTQKHH